ncbi:MAG TPA: Ig-like domain-containing protein [Candidatus Paceibacterota bacterium]
MPAKKVSLDNTNEKPSLASLKPDKKGTAAQKRAVKKIDAAATTKVPAKRTRTATLKKMAASKAAAVAEPVVAPKSTAGQSKPKKAAVKKVATKPEAEKPKKATAKKAEAPRKPTEFAIKLPTNMSIRAREKALVILYAIDKDFRAPAQRIAYISGFVFVMFGSLLSMSYALGAPASQVAIVASTTETLNSTVNDTTTTLNNTVLKPIFSSNETLPAILTADYAYTFTVTNSKNVSGRLYSFVDGRKISLNVERVQTDTYRAFIRTGDLNAGEYKLELIAESAQDGSKVFHNAGKFVVEKGTTITRTDNSGEGSVDSDSADEDSEDSSGSGSTSDGESEREETSDTDSEAAETTASSTEIIEKTVETIAKELTRPQISVNDYTFSKQEIVKVQTPPNTRAVEVYVRSLKSIQSLFLGSAVEGSTHWYYFFDTLQVPNGDYELYVRSRSDGATYVTSPSFKIRVANTTAAPAPVEPTAETTAPAPEPVTEEELDTSDTAEAPESVPVINTVRSFSEIPPEEFARVGTTTQAAEGVEEEINFVLSDYRDELMELMRRYAVAQQSGDPMMIDIARKALMDSKSKLITDVLRDNQANHLADDIDEILTERFGSLQKRVDTFEQLRKSANSEGTSLDTDNDGISDFDEKNLYGTNVEEADTDQDGIIDGVEIMRGFDPLDATAEAVIEYELPQESIALVQEEALAVEHVVPIIQTDDSGGNLPVFAEIKGKALPNSFVTLYIFSTPTIVTVKTDTDGSFVYTFEKELEDGAHEVYVAVTDNTGAIMARSNPFRFVKEAQAFTPVDTENSEVVSSETLSEFTSMNSYNIAVGIGILAFGLILLMLGVSLREKDPMAVMAKPKKHDLKVT